MNEIRIDLIIEPGTPFEFLENGKIYVDAIRTLLNPISDEINNSLGYVEVKQRKDGNFGVSCHATSMELINKMDKIILDAAGG